MGEVYNSVPRSDRALNRVGRAQRILVVDDDERVRRLLRETLASGGYRVVEARCEAEVMAALRKDDVDLITLDLSLRHEDGLSIARSIRSFSDIPIVMVTARSEDIDRIVGLELGADDYIAKPFNVREVLARVRAILRRAGKGEDTRRDKRAPEVLQFAGWVFDTGTRTLRSPDSQSVALTTAEFRMLHVFATHPGRVLSREVLLDMVGGTDADALERSIDTIVSRLRRKIERDATAPMLIKTVRGAGYVFTPKITF